MTARAQFQAFGAGYEIQIDAAPQPGWIDLLFPFPIATDDDVIKEELLDLVTSKAEDENGLYYKGERLCGFSDFNRDNAEGIEGNIQFVVAKNAAPKYIFLHAGAVSVDGKGIILPSSTNRGKTTLTKAFLDRGAEYFSDDCAVIDQTGLLHPYPSNLKIRTGGKERDLVDPRSAGYTVGSGPVEVGCVLFTEFADDARFRPSRISPADASMELLKNLFLPALIRDNPKETMSAVSAVVDGSVLLKGPRGEADLAAVELISRLS